MSPKKPSDTGAEAAQVSEAQIAVHWREEGYYFPPAKFVGQANANDPAIFDRFAEDKFPEYFKEYADLLDWDHYWTRPSTRRTRRSGSGSSAASSTPRTTASTGTSRRTPTRPR